MTFILSPYAQGTEGWRVDRLGKATGSKADCITAKSKTKGVEATTRRNYRVQLVCERLTGKVSEEGYQSRDMVAGTENEPFARMAQEQATGMVIREAGFAYLPSLPAGCSVDGFIDDGDALGFLEVKCPKSAIHLGYLEAGRLPPEYVPQITHNFFVTGAAFCDFVSYDPRMPEKLQLFTVRILREEVAIAAYTSELVQFLAETAELEQRLRLRAA